MAERQINSGIEQKRIVAYLEEELGIVPQMDGRYILPGCVITLESLKEEHSILQIPRTLVTFSGEEEVCEQWQKQFRLRFLSAGG